MGTGKDNVGIPALERVIRLVSVKFDVTVFQLYPVNEGYRVEHVRLVSVYSTSRLVRNLKLLSVFRKAHSRERFDVVHGFWTLPCGLLAVILGKLLSVKSVISLQGGDAVSMPQMGYGQLRRWLPRKLAFWAMKRADVLISPTHYLVDNLVKLGFRRPDIELIPLGVDTSLFSFRGKQSLKKVEFLSVGNLHPVKDPFTLLETFRRIAARIDCHLTVIGEGPCEERLKTLAREWKISDRISFLGLLPHHSLADHYHIADILLHTSCSEGHPIVVEEAMSCGVLVCGTRVGLIYDLKEACISAAVGDFESLAAETLSVISDPKRMTMLREVARKWAHAHSINWTVDQLSIAYS